MRWRLRSVKNDQIYIQINESGTVEVFSFCTLQRTTINLAEESRDKPAVGLTYDLSYTLDRTVKNEYVLILYRKSECSMDYAVCLSSACEKSYVKRRTYQFVRKCLVLINIQ